MAVLNSVNTVGTTVTEIVGPALNAQYVYVQNGDFDGTAEIYVGDKDVTSSNGFRVWRNNNVMLQIEGGDSLYAIADTDATPIRIINIRQ